MYKIIEQEPQEFLKLKDIEVSDLFRTIDGDDKSVYLCVYDYGQNLAFLNLDTLSICDEYFFDDENETAVEYLEVVSELKLKVRNL